MSSIGSPAQRLSGNCKGEDQREGRRRMCDLGSMPQCSSCPTGAGLLLQWPCSQPPWDIPTSSKGPQITARGNSSEKLRGWQRQGEPQAGIGCGIPPSGPLGRPTAMPWSPFGRWYPKWCEAEGSAAFPLQRLGSAPSPFASDLGDLSLLSLHGAVKTLSVQYCGRCHGPLTVPPGGRTAAGVGPVPRGLRLPLAPSSRWRRGTSSACCRLEPPPSLPPAMELDRPYLPAREPPPTPPLPCPGRPRLPTGAARSRGGGVRARRALWAAILRGTRRPPLGSGVEGRRLLLSQQRRGGGGGTSRPAQPRSAPAPGPLPAAATRRTERGSGGGAAPAPALR